MLIYKGESQIVIPEAMNAIGYEAIDKARKGENE